MLRNTAGLLRGRHPRRLALAVRPRLEGPQGPVPPVPRRRGGLRGAVSATVKTTILTNAQQPIMPTQSRHLRQRIFTISTNAGAYASIDERTMLSGGAGRGGEEPDRRVGHVQGSGHKAQLQRHSEALRQGQAHRGVVLEGRGRAAPTTGAATGRARSTRTSRRWPPRRSCRESPRRASTSGCCTGIPARTWPATTPSPSSCARTASPSGPPAARSRTRASRRRPDCSCSSTGRSPSRWRTATASCSSSTCSRRRWAIPAGTYSSGRGPGRPTTWSGACTPRSRGSAACRASGSRTTCPPW